MIKWTPYIFVRLTLYLITGIVLGIYCTLSEDIYYLLLFCFTTLVLLYWSLLLLINTVWKGRRLRSVFGLLAVGIISLFGLLLTYQKTGAYQESHILQQESTFKYYSAIVVSEVQEREKTYKAEVEISKIYQPGKWQYTSGKVLVYLNKQGIKPAYGSKLIIKGTPQAIPGPANPGEFNYRQYLRYQQIYFQQFIKASDFVIYGYDPPNPVLALSIRIRQYADGVFKDLIRSPREYAIATGLILGIRNGLDNEIKQAYASAGAMHVLAVSGAHVVIVFEIIALLLIRLKKLKYGNWVFALTVLSILWLYAFVTGLSSSVLRAVVMFSFVVIAQAARKQSSIYNTLAVSAFILLCYNPYYLMDVGFQLSYAAVLGIVYLFPKIYYLLKFDNTIADKAWAITCVSFAAQVATVPMSLFYFHQFPVYFLLANLAVIPVSTGVLYLGLLTLAVSWIPYLSIAVAFLLKWMVWLLNQCVLFTETIPGALIQGISIGFIEMIGLYTIIVLVLLFLYYKKLQYWFAVFCLLCILTTLQILETNRQHTQQELLIYAINKHSAISMIEGNKNLFLADSALLHNQQTINFHLMNDWWEKGIRETAYFDLHKAQPNAVAIRQKKEYTWLVWQGKTFLFLHQPLHRKSGFLQLAKADYLVVQNNAIRKLDGMNAGFKHLIIDTSNKKYLAQRLKQDADRLHIPCYSLHNSGAFTLNK